MPVTPLVPSIPPLAAALGADALIALALGLARLAWFPAHDLATRCAGAVHLALAYGTLLVARATASGNRRLVARSCALSLTASAAMLLSGATAAQALDATLTGYGREWAHAAALALAAAYAFATSPARRPLR